MKLLLITLCIFMLANNDDNIGRRGFLKKIVTAYKEGRATANEQRIVQRKEAEKMRRRQVFERNVKSLVDGLSKRLKHRRSTVSIVVIGGVALVVWLCHKGSVGCERSKTRRINDD